jgi:HlyD family secretion protein
MKLTKKKLSLLALLLAVCVVVGLFFIRSKGDGAQYRTAPVTKGDIRATVSATGTVNAVTTVLVGTQVSGTIKNIYVDFNSPVKKGQRIADIDPATFQAQLDQARANVMAARANVAKAQATLNDSKRTMERNKQLWERNLIARSDFDTAETNLNSNQAVLQATQAQVSQQEAAMRLAETNLRYTRIVSPVDGIVVSRAVDVGQTVAASFQTPTLFTIAQDLTKMQINTSVDEADIGRIQSNQAVDFTVDAYPDDTFKGRVDQVRIAPITVQNVVTYDVVIKVDNSDLRLKPGMTANVSIVTAEKSGVLRIPNAALRFKPANSQTARPGRTDGNRMARPANGLWIQEGKDLRREAIVPGISDGAYTEVVSGDLKEGQLIAVESIGKNSTKSPAGGPQQGMPRFMR